MEHIEFFYYILTFAIGFGTLFIYTIITVRTRDKLLWHILLFYFAFTFQIFMNIIQVYVRANVPDLYLSGFFYFMILFNISHSIMLFSIPFFTAYLAKFPYKKSGTIVYALIALGHFVLEFIGHKVEIIGNEVVKTHIFPLSGFIEDGLLLGVIIYATLLGIFSIKKMTDPQVKKLLRNVCITSLVFFPGLVLEALFYKQLPLPFFPALYCTFCIVFILFVIKVYFRDYYISESEVDLLVTSNKKEAKEGGEEGIFAHYNLSEREIDTIRLVLKGHSNKKIADELFISLSTVKTHIHNVFKKTEVSNRYELIHLIKFKDRA